MLGEWVGGNTACLERYAGDAGIKLARLGGGLPHQVTVKDFMLPGEIPRR